MPNKRRRLLGRIVSDNMDKTVVVEVETTRQHQLYGKVIRTTQRYLAHDESNAIPLGSTVRIVESRPLSKRKRWVVEEVIQETTPAEAAVVASEVAGAVETVVELDELEADTETAPDSEAEE